MRSQRCFRPLLDICVSKLIHEIEGISDNKQHLYLQLYTLHILTLNGRDPFLSARCSCTLTIILYLAYLAPRQRFDFSREINYSAKNLKASRELEERAFLKIDRMIYPSLFLSGGATLDVLGQRVNPPFLRRSIFPRAR